MVKKQSKKNKPKTQKTGKKRAKMSRPMSGPNRSLVEAVCSNLNAFCPAAKGAKLFDENAEPSQVFQNRSIVTITTDANGNAGLYFTSAPDHAYYTATINAGGTTTAWTQNTNSFYTTYVTGATLSLYRVVSWGIRVVGTESAMVAKGNLLMLGCGSRLEASNVGQTVSGLNQGYSADFTPFRECSVELMGKPLGRASTDYIGIGAMPSYSSNMIFVSGATPSVPVGVVEFIVNYEFITITSTGLNQSSTKAAPSVPEVMAIRANAAADRPLVTRFIDGITSDTSWMRTVENNIMNVGSLLSTAASFIPQARGARMLLGGASTALRLMN